MKRLIYSIIFTLGVSLFTYCSKNVETPSILNNSQSARSDAQEQDEDEDQGAKHKERIIQEVSAVIQQHTQLMYEGDPLKTAQAYTPDGVLTVGGIAIINGFDALKSFYTSFFSTYKTTNLIYHDGVWSISKSGTVAVLSTSIELKLKNKTTNEITTLLIDITSVLEKHGNKWLALVEQNSLRVPLL